MASTTEPPTRELQEEPRTARRPRPPVRRRPLAETGGRRLQPAGIAILIILIAAAVGTVLNAQGLRKTAQIQPEGTGRDISLALTKPLAAVSHALYLDRPRQGLKEALGRGDDDTIDTTIALPTPPSDTTNPAASTGGGETSAQGGANPTAPTKKPDKTVPARKEAFSPKKKLRIWVAGDSLAITPGESILRILPDTKVIKPVGPVDGRVATGLERPDVFNWFAYIPQQVRRLDPNAVILTFGANDDHSYMTGTPAGTDPNAAFGSREWVREYRRRVGGIMDLASRGGHFVVWIGIPITRSATQSQRFRLLNRIYKSEALKRPGRVAFVDTYDLFQDENGHYADYLTNKKGQLVLVRAPDGVHFQPAGGDIVARAVLQALREQFDLTSWKKHQRG